ncbi:MAG: hypothetical protein KC468_30190 [Myxococcales bacterium]|nr:hypothetical protein [Myxococcales bacterium]
MRLTPIGLLAVTTCAPRPDLSPSAAVAPAPAPVEAPARDQRGDRRGPGATQRVADHRRRAL